MTTSYSKQTFVGRLRAKIWYWAVISCGRWSDYRLDMEFGQPDDEPKRPGIYRNRVFDTIRKNGTRPSKGNHSRRKFDLIERVERHDNFRGTKKIYDSLFWDVINSQPQDLDTSTQLVNRCLERLNLKRLHGHDVLNWMWIASPRFASSLEKGVTEGKSHHFEFWLDDSTQNLPVDLDLLALFGAMYREACLSFAPELAEVHGRHFNNALEVLCKEDWIQPLGEDLRTFEEIARSRILYGIDGYLPDNGSRFSIFKPEITVQGIVISKDVDDVEKYLRERELVGDNYRVITLDVTKPNGHERADEKNKK